MTKRKGFTLVELLVVIAIIAILAGALMIAINPNALIQKSRDAKRIQDIDTLVKALNLALAEGEITLAATANPGSSGTGTRVLDGTGWVSYAIPVGKTGLSKYVSSLPVDPLNTDAYVYTYAATATNYEVNGVLESPENTTKMSTDGGNNATAYEVGTSLAVMN